MFINTEIRKKLVRMGKKIGGKDGEWMIKFFQLKKPGRPKGKA